MKYPKYTDYEKMYKRYFDKGVEYLIDKADLKRDDKGNWSVVYNMYGGITCMISLNESEALWISEINNKIYREKFDKAFTEALQTFLFKELDKCDKEVLS